MERCRTPRSAGTPVKAFHPFAQRLTLPQISKKWLKFLYFFRFQLKIKQPKQ